MTAPVIPLPRREQSPCQQVVDQVATRRDDYLRLYENRVFHELDRQCRAVLTLTGTIPAKDVAMSLAFHYELARIRLARRGIT